MSYNNYPSSSSLSSHSRPPFDQQSKYPIRQQASPREEKHQLQSPPPPQPPSSSSSFTRTHSNPNAAPPSDSHQRQHAQLLTFMKVSDFDVPQYTFSSHGPINWKALWNGLLSGQQNSLRAWVNDLPIKGCKVNQFGQLDVGASSIPASFVVQLNEMLDKAVPPLADIVIDTLCWRGVFLPSELANFDILSIRLARNLLLLRPAGKRENKPLSLERFLPFGQMAPFHTYMLTKRLKPHLYEHQTLRKAYITWYKLKEFMEELDRPKPKRKMIGLGDDEDDGLGSPPAGFNVADYRRPAGPGIGIGLNGRLTVGSGSVLIRGSLLDRPKKDSEMSQSSASLGDFVQGYGYVRQVREDGTPVFGSEDEALQAIKDEAALEEEEARVKIAAEIDDIQLQAAEQLVKSNFNFTWLKLLGIPSLKVHPLHLYHDQVSDKLNREIDSMMPSHGKGVNLLQNQPSEQILMLILYLIYKNTPTRAMRISIPLLASNPRVMYRYLSVLVCKVALASCLIQSKSQKRSQASCMAYLKMVQQYCNTLDTNKHKCSNGAAADGDVDQVIEGHTGQASPAPSNASDQNDDHPLYTVHGLPRTQNYAFVLSLLLDFVAIFQRYLNLQQVLNIPSLSSLLPIECLASFERLHLPSLIWLVFEAIERRRNSRLDIFKHSPPPPLNGPSSSSSSSTESEYEAERDSRMIAWILAVGMKLYRTIVDAKKSSTHQTSMGREANNTSITLLYHLISLHMLTQTPFPDGIGECIKQEQGGFGPTPVWIQLFLYIGGMGEEEPIYLVRRLLQLYEEGFFNGQLEKYHTLNVDDRVYGEMVRSGSSPLSGLNPSVTHKPVTGVMCLEHLLLTLAPYSGILLARPGEDETESETNVRFMTVKQKQLHDAQRGKPIWDKTSEILLRIAYDPMTQNIMNMSTSAKAAYLLNKCQNDEILLSLAFGMGANSGDSLLHWFLAHHASSKYFTNIPSLPLPGPTPPKFTDRSAPLEKVVLRAVKIGMWYSLIHGFEIFAPKNVLLHVLRFLKYFTQRRYSECHAELDYAFRLLHTTSNLQQPQFGKHHFFAVISTGASGMDINARNLQSYQWTQRMIVQMLRMGLLIGMQGGVPLSHRMTEETMLRHSSKQMNAQGYSSIDLTDYDRNFLIDLFGGILTKYGPSSLTSPRHTSSTSIYMDTTGNVPSNILGSELPVFNMSMMNEILSIIPPTVSSSFLLNITSLQINGPNSTSVASGGANLSKQSHRLKHEEHKYTQYQLRLTTWKDHEQYYQRKINEVTSLLDLELIVGISLDERHRLIRSFYLEMDELCILPNIRAAIWYQMNTYFHKQTHATPDSLRPMLSNSSVHLIPGAMPEQVEHTVQSSQAQMKSHVHPHYTSQTPAQTHHSGGGGGGGIGVTTAPESLSKNNLEHSSEKEECQQELILLYLAYMNWLVCLDGVTRELTAYFASHPHEKPTPKLVSQTAEGKPIYSQTEFEPARARDGTPIHPPQEIRDKMQQQSQYQYVCTRLRGRIYWLMVLHGLNNLRDPPSCRIEYDLNTVASRRDWELRRAERESIKYQRDTARMMRRAQKEAEMIVERASKEAGIDMDGKQLERHQSDEKQTDANLNTAGVESDQKHGDLPPLPQSVGGVDSSDFHIPLTEEDLADDQLDADDAEEQAKDCLFPPLVIDFLPIARDHASAAEPGTGGSIAGLAYGLEKFHVLSPSQYLPWNGSPSQTPTSAVAEAAARHRAIAIAFDEDMDITRLTPAEVRLLAEYSIDTKFTLALVEHLFHTHQFRSALCLMSDILTRFPSVRLTPRMQAAIGLCDCVQLLFWIAHPTLQDVRINHILSGSIDGMPFAGLRTQLVLAEHLDPFARVYKELLAWPIMPHVLREEDQTWLRMRWYGGGTPSNQTLMLQRLLVDTPTGSLYQNLLLTLLLANDPSRVSAIYSRTRPVGVEVKEASSSSGGLASSFFKSIGAAIKGTPSSTGEGAPNSNGDNSIDVEHLRQWLIDLDESARVELLDRFVSLAIEPHKAKLTAQLIQPGGLAGAAATFGLPENQPRSTGKQQGHSLLKESFNSSFTALTLRHLPLLCEISQYLAASVRITSVELTKPRNKKLHVEPTPGVRITPTAFLNSLINLLVKTRVTSKRLASSIPQHYTAVTRPLPDENSPTYPWLMALAEKMAMPVLELLQMTPAQLIGHLWRQRTDRSAISTLLQSDQIYRHFVNHSNYVDLDREVNPSDLSAALVETFLLELREVDRLAGPPSPFTNFQLGEWWSRSELIAFIGLADRTQSMALPTLAAAFRAQAFVIIRARDPASAISSSLLSSSDASASNLLGWWLGPKDKNRPFVHNHGSGEFVRLTPGSMIEFELLHASYQCYLSAGRTLEMRQVASDLRSGLQSLLTSVMTKSKTPAPPIITSPTNPNETIPPPFAGASMTQVEHIFLARLQIERCANLINNGETRDAIVNIWRQFKKKAPATFA